MNVTPVAPFPSASGQIVSHLVWLVMPLGVLAYLLVLPAVRRSVASHFARTLDFFAPRTPTAAPAPAAPDPVPAGQPEQGEDEPPVQGGAPGDAPDAEILAAMLAAYATPPDEPGAPAK